MGDWRDAIPTRGDFQGDGSTMANVRRKFRLYGRRKEEVLKSSRGSDQSSEGTLLKLKELNVASRMMNPSSDDIQCSSKPPGNDMRKVSLKPMKTLIAEEISKETECRRRSPSIIARLMGLDALPANEGTPKQKRTSTKGWYGKTTTEEQQRISQPLLHDYEQYPGKFISNRTHPSQSSAMDHGEFKDVFEVEEISKVRQSCYSGNLSGTATTKIPESSDAFLRNNSVDRNCPLTDEKIRHSKEFPDVMPHVDSRRDLFRRVLLEPDLPFTENLHNLHHVPSHFGSDHITFLRSSTDVKSGSGTSTTKIPESRDAFPRNNSVDRNCPLTDEKIWHSKEFPDVMPHVDSRRDLFRRVLPEPDLPFTEHLNNLQHVPSHFGSDHITVLRSSRNSIGLQFSDKYANGEIYWRSQRKCEGQVSMQKSSCRCPCNHNATKLNYGCVCPSHRPCKSLNEKSDDHPTPTRIVVLKPSQHKVLPDPAVLPAEVAYRNDWLLKNRVPSRQDLCEKVIGRQRLSENTSGVTDESIRLRWRGSREIAKEVTRQLRQNVGRSSFNMPSLPTTVFKMDDDHSHKLSREDSLAGLGVVAPCRWSAELNNEFNSSPSYLMKSPVNLENRKHLSHQCKVGQRSGELKHPEDGSSTLNETPCTPKADNKKGKPFVTLGEMTGQEGSSDDLAAEAALTGWSYTSGPRHRDFRQEGYAINLLKPRPRSCSWTRSGLPRSIGRFPSVDEIENDLIAREVISPGSQFPFFLGRHSGPIKQPFASNSRLDGYASHSSRSVKKNDDHLMLGNSCLTTHQNLAGARSIYDKRVLSEQCPLFTDFPVDAEQPEEFVLVSDCHSEITYDDHDKHFCRELEPSVDSTNLKKAYAPTLDPDNSIEVSSAEPSVADDARCDSLHHKDNAEQPSPVSILEPPFEEEFSSSAECFDKISVGLEGLRKQLHLLRMQSLENDAEGSDSGSSMDDDFTDGCFANLDQTEPLEEENMEFSFLCDALLSAGFYGDQDSLPNVWFSPECLINPRLFEELDKKYSKNDKKIYSITAKDSRVLRLERRLLFDRINEGIEEVLKPSPQVRPWAKLQFRSWMPQALTGWQLIEKIWELIQMDKEAIGGSETEIGEELVLDMMVRKDLRTDGQWLEFGEDVDLIGIAIEDALLDDLIVQVVGELEAQ